MRDLSYTRVLTSDASFQIVRTNPKLTGNLKITINEGGEMWLNAIKANSELAKDDYSRYPIDVTHSLAANIFGFLKNGSTPNEIVFGLTEKVDVTKTAKDLKDQYDFSNYFSGVKYFPSNKYSEKFSYFAPIYLKKNLPKYFVIFKIKDPLNHPVDVSKLNYESGESKTDYLIDLFKKSTIIKTFDLSENSVPGQYLRSYLSSTNFPTSPLSVSFGDSEHTSWNGILIDSGIMGSRQEFANMQFSSSTPLKAFEEEITKGFERNGIIFPNILNLEFIFDDTTSSKYEMNRYLGLYLDSIELSKFDVDLNRAYLERGTWENTPKFKRNYTEDEQVNLNQANPNGLIIPYKNMSFNMTEFQDVFTDSETLYFNYVTDKFGKLHLPKLDGPYSIDLSPSSSIELVATQVGEDTEITATSLSPHSFSVDDLVIVSAIDEDFNGSFFVTSSTPTSFTYLMKDQTGLSTTTSGTAVKEIGIGKMRLSDTSIELDTMFGPSNQIFLQDTAFVAAPAGKSFTVFTVNDQLAHGDKFTLYHPSGTRLDANGKFDEFYATIGYELVPDPSDHYAFNDYLNTNNGNDVFYFNGSGRPYEIASALAGCLNEVRNKTFTAYAYNEHVFIICNVKGEFDDIHKVSYYSPQEAYLSVDIDGTPSSDTIGDLIPFKGGSKYENARLVLDRAHLSKITNELDQLLVKTKEGWSKIKKVSKYIDLVDEENSIENPDRLKVIAEYKDNIVLVLEDDERPTISYTQCMIRRKFRPSFGLISMFPIKDLDFDFYKSSYFNFPEIDLYQHYFVPEGVFLLEQGKEYKVSGGSIAVSDGATYVDGDQFTVTSPSKYSTVDGAPFVYYYSGSSVGDSLTVPIQDQNGELQDFQGFAILKDPDKIVASDSSLKYTLQTKYLNGLSTTEYDFYKENDSIDFATRSKIVPYINKWGIKGGFDSRDNPYRLNTELVFGRNNFSPDHEDRSQNPINFTHEWFYIESKFNYVNDPETVKKNNYYFDTPIDMDRLLSEDGYFLEYFTYSPSFGENRFTEKIDVAPTQFRYSTLFKNAAGEYETFFKGFKAIFRDVTDPNTLGIDGKPVPKKNTSRFDGYKFSCILKPIQEDLLDDTVAPIKYRVIEHKDFKFIVVVIEVAIGHIDQISDHWKEWPMSNQPLRISNDPDAYGDDVHLADPSYTSEFGSDLPFETINGDYRISFEQIDDLSISNLTHSMLYSLKNKKFNSIQDNFSNTKISSKVKITSSGITPTSIERLPNVNIPEYPSMFSDEILDPSKLNYVVGVNTLTNVQYFIDQVDQTVIPATSISENPIVGSNSDFLIYSLVTGCNLRLTSPTSIYPYLAVSLPFLGQSFQSVISANFSFFTVAGGKNYFEKMIEKLSFAKFKDYTNRLDPMIEYESWILDQGGQAVQSTANFYLDIPDRGEVNKTSQVTPVVDTDRPAQFSFESVVGYKYATPKLAVPVSLNRYRGEYEPIAEDLLHCRSSFKFTKNMISELNLSNTKLNSNVSTMLTVQNFNHIKVADSKILELESDQSYLPVYPKIGEVPIGTSPMFLMSSNWDWGFHSKYDSSTSSSPVAGSVRVEEDENFLGKVIALVNEIELEQFNLTVLGPNESLADVDLGSIELVIKEGDHNIEGSMNLNNVLTSYLLNDGISQKFNEFLINSYEFIGNFDSIEQYVKEYIKLNILKLYSIDVVEFYSKRNAAVSSESSQNVNSAQFFFLDDSERFDEGFSILKTVQINRAEKLILSFNIQKPFDAGLEISPKVKLKFI